MPALFACLSALWLLGVASPWLTPAAAEVPLGAHVNLSCNACHLIRPDGQPVLPIALLTRQESLCGECHPDASAARLPTNHPSGFVPKRPIPAGFPLDAYGRLTCSTCHDMHAETPVLLRGGEAWPCLHCHPR